MKQWAALLAAGGVCIAVAALAANPPSSTAALTTPATAKTESTGDESHICTDKDLAGGTWKMIYMREVPARYEEINYDEVPYQYITFYSDHTYSFLGVSDEIRDGNIVKKDLDQVHGLGHKLSYSLDGGGVLNLYLDNNIRYSYRCNAIAKPMKSLGYQPGDLVLKGYTKNKSSELFKLYRRWF